MTDETTNSTVELCGGDLKPFVGKQVTVTDELTPAEPVAAGVPSVVTVASIERANTSGTARAGVSA
jgi:hypothetical protein